MAETGCEVLDPRIRRTRMLLQQALGKLLETKEFEKISVQDIAEAATLNRATFYDHYPDKFALLECMVAGRFHELLAARGVVFNAGCGSALKGIILGVCDYLAGMPRLECERQRQMEPHLESSVIAVVRRLLLNGLKQHRAASSVPAEMAATTASWAIYGAAKEWVHTPQRCASEEIVEMVMLLVSPILARMEVPASGA
ncbi:MAG TPA: TetR/AcrR family transcriptional regulator [Granulicella sp.]|jgi:AcrR family transcriptional regulator|nr:TetR/AcrR family transcriptional regulator [Granulicella sp.]